MTRLYLPSTLPDLARDWPLPGPDAAGALAAGGEGEEEEYAALMGAADASAERLAGLPDGSRRRVVLVVEGAADPAAPRWAEVVAVHVDDADDADPDDDLGWYAVQEVGDLLARL